MKYRYVTCLFFAAFILQTTLMNAINIAGVTPNLLLCLVVIFSFLYDENYYGIVYGVVFGLLYDICFAQYTGITALIFLGLSIAIILASIIMNKELILSVVIVSAGATTAHTLAYWAITAMLGSNYSFIYVIQFLPLYILYNMAVVIILYYAMIKKVIRHHNDRYYR